MKKQSLCLHEKAVLVNIVISANDDNVKKLFKYVNPLLVHLNGSYITLALNWDGKYRLLPIDNFNKLVDTFNYCKSKLKDIDPSIDVRIYFMLIPENDQLSKLVIDNKTYEDIWNNVERTFDIRLMDAIADIKKQLVDFLESTIGIYETPDLLYDVSLRGEKKRISNIADLNIFNDTSITKLCDDIKKVLHSFTEHDVMHSEIKRKNLSSKLKEILYSITGRKIDHKGPITLH